MKKDLLPVSGTPHYRTSPEVTSELSVKIGGNEADFLPQLDLSAWGGECSLSITPANHGRGNASFDEASRKLHWTDDDNALSMRFYNLDIADDTPEGGLEIEAVLTARPSGDKLEFDVQSSGLVFFHQPPLSALIGQDGIASATDTEGYDEKGNLIAQRPAKIVNSYAVYASEKKKNYDSGKVYKSGKVCHIYRPLITDAGNNSVYGTLSFNKNFTKLTISIPKDFLDNAAYPVVVDPTFGYTTIGGTQSTKNAGAPSICHIADVTYQAQTGDKIIKFTAYGRGSGSPTMDMAAYNISASIPVNRLGAATPLTLPSSDAWTDSAAISRTLTGGTVYGLANGNFSATLYTYYDTGSSSESSYNTDTGALPVTWSHAGYASSIGSRYATYSNNVTVSITGQRVISSGGTAKSSLTKSSSGQRGTSGSGTAKSSLTKSPSGQRGTSGSGTAKSALTIPAVGARGTSTAGTVIAKITGILSGKALVTAAGNVKAALSRLLSGNRMTGTPGTPSSSITDPLTGQAATARTGTPVPGAFQPLTGQRSVSRQGTVAHSAVIPAIGANAAATPGTPTGETVKSASGQRSTLQTGTVAHSQCVKADGSRVVAAAGFTMGIVNVINLPGGIVLDFEDDSDAHPVKIMMAATIYGLFDIDPTDDRAGAVRVMIGDTKRALAQWGSSDSHLLMMQSFQDRLIKIKSGAPVVTR